jgi:hypothetical protein
MGVYPTEVNTMSSEIVKVADTDTKKQQNVHIIRVAILAEEPLHWGSGKHFFPVILENYTWTTRSTIYTIKVRYVYDADILKGRLMTNEFDILLVPGGGVGDGQAVMKGIMISRNVRKWKKNISAFIERGGGYVGICGGTALMTDLKTKENKPRSFLEKMYDKSALGISCVSSYYPSLAMPLFYLSQKKYPERIGAISYVFSFAPGVTTDGVRVHTGGVPIETIPRILNEFAGGVDQLSSSQKIQIGQSRYAQNTQQQTYQRKKPRRFTPGVTQGVCITCSFLF